VIDEETIGPARDVMGEPLEPCDLCGQVAPRLYVIRLSGFSAIAEPVEMISVCESCRLRVEQDDVPFDEEIGAGLQAADE
jgi:hypothetical protein